MKKTADWMWMPFGMVSGVGRGMGVLDGAWRSSMGRNSYTVVLRYIITTIKIRY